MLGNPSRGQPNIHDIASNGDVAQMEALLASNPDLMSEAEGGTLKTPLHLACERGDLELVALLLARGADTAARDRHQLTPLFAAVKRNAAKVVRLLLRSGGSQADPPPPPQGGNGGGGGEPTPQGRLSGWSTRPSHSTSTTTAVATPSASTPSSSPASDPNVVAKKGETPLLWAARFGKASVVRALLKAGADVHYCPGRQAGGVQLRTALHCAAASGREDLVRLLLAHGASLNVVDGEGKTPIFSAVKYDQGPLFSAIKYQKTEAVECLLKAGTRTVDVNLQDKAGMTALHHASKESYREGTEQLLCCERIDVNVADSRGKTPQDYVVDDTIRDLFVERITTGTQLLAYPNV
ncbi:Ankyrin repeat/Protein kinase domain containing protein [Acanthamoeba castellanii str. Neff]|uniref:Ankyrin repeat/Protein kinase domain containing protein n=1 Tax=Acanthamoeba castellanii (strain ATCC 30010 / Neff) TaxID=1257118 RepID=L8H6M6_ACACF|nr:Ankyrin repeat/Protein kinase domain containing protein [Acanthamoeba castellanii str. Neff]ELR20902.1 Ankyrin repeat/Protein kinase domain containing protein [Acanthamoeba castellanii str. Neff]